VTRIRDLVRVTTLALNQILCVLSFFLSLLQLVALSRWCVKSAIGIRAAEEV
jgi:hypothetical protein